jgi:N6-L-threonylcarbamoyladenine synthase
MTILAIETSCDETSVAVVCDGRYVLSNIVASQTELHELYGGVVPEIASRRHIELIRGLTEQALEQANILPPFIKGVPSADGGGFYVDAIACTTAPGLIGALLVGLSFAKAMAFGLGVPFIPVHHIRGHVAANYLAYPELEPPFIALVASGGHSSILHVTDYTEYKTLGITRDDAAGECFDKIARVMGLGYPGGPLLDKLAVGGNPYAFKLPRAKIDGHPLDMSFSGLKTSVINIIHNAEQRGEALNTSDLAASFSQAVSDTLISRLKIALEQTGERTVVLAGGVAANAWLRRELLQSVDGKKVYLSPLELCGDNAAMIGAQGFYEFMAGNVSGLSHNALATRAADERLC